MTITIPSGRVIDLKAKAGGGFESVGLGGGGGGGSNTITGTGFGAGPDVVLFASADGTSGELVGLTDPEIGDYAELEVKAFEHAPGVRYHTKNSKTWITGRDPLQLGSTSKLMTGVRFALDTPSDRFRVAYKLAAADNQKMPGAAAVGGSPSDENASVFKTIWVDYLNGFGNSNPDTCIPTWLGDSWTTIGGNDVTPKYNVTGRANFSSSAFDFSAGENLVSYVSGQPESVAGAWDGVISWMLAVQGATPSFTRTRRTDAEPFNSATTTFADRLWQDFCFPGWYGNTSYVDVLPLYRDLYVAVGNNCEACLILSDSTTLSASTEFAIIPADTWTDTEITYTPRVYDPSFRHLILADGTLMENV